jgi:hypothetical protein
VVGRGLGILVGLMLLTLFRNTTYLGFVFECLALMVFFYVYFSDRLAYTFLNAGLYVAVIMHIGRATPGAAAPQGTQMFIAVVVGVVVADLVNWFSGAERDLSIRTSGNRFFPIDRGRLGRCFTLTATVALSQFMVTYFDLPIDATLVSDGLRLLLVCVLVATTTFRLARRPVIHRVVSGFVSCPHRRRLVLCRSADGARATHDLGCPGSRLREDDDCLRAARRRRDCPLLRDPGKLDCGGIFALDAKNTAIACAIAASTMQRLHR